MVGLIDLNKALGSGDEIAVPERVSDFTPDRRKIYTVGDEPNHFLVREEEGAYQGYITIPQLRLEAFRARRQANKSGRIDLVTFMTFVADDEVVGTLTPNGYEPLAPYTNERFKNWNDRNTRPHRIYGQNWGSDPELTLELLTYLQSLGWRARKGSPATANTGRRRNQGGKERTYYDVFTARPPQPSTENNQDINWREQWGTKVEAIEITVNDEYENGFQNFVDGVLRNVARLDDAAKIKDPADRAEALELAARFCDSITGYTVNKDDGVIWARHADIGMVKINGHEYRIWDSGTNEDITVDDLMGGESKIVKDTDDKIEIGDLTGNPDPTADDEPGTGEIDF